jgi:hypothetical protein
MEDKLMKRTILTALITCLAVGTAAAQSYDSKAVGANGKPLHGAAMAESHDSFVFAPNLGENTSVHSNMHDETIDHPKSEFTQFAELLSQPHQDAANLPHDAADPVHHAATLSAQQAHHFLV